MWSCTFVACTLLFFTTALRGSQGVFVNSWERNAIHLITGNISFPSPTSLVIDGFNYDGNGIVVYLYYYAPGQAVDDESGRILPLTNGEADGRLPRRRHTNEQLVVSEFPSGVTACDIGTLTIWCEPFTATFARLTIPRSVFINDGEGACELVGGNTDLPTVPTVMFDNCEAFSDNLQVSWTVDNENQELRFQICSCRPLDAGVNQYMAFGLSGRNDSTFMVGADATVAWVDNAMGTPNAVDYYLTGRQQCRGGEGVCPDTMVTGPNNQVCRNDVREDSIIGGIRSNNQQCVIFSRPFQPVDDECDIPFDVSSTDQYIVWANGGLGATAFIHFDRADPSSPPIHLGRTALDNCVQTPIECTACQPFIGKSIDLPGSTTLRVRIGPSARERGYMGITGQVGWGISWYVNGTLIPELTVRRGNTYTFIVEGGNDPNNTARYHPFYITDSMSGGRLLNDPEDRQSETVYAGFDGDVPTGVGRLCEYQQSSAANTILDTCGSFEDYLREVISEEPSCFQGNPGTLVWTPDDSTPDTVFYQCATHLNLGWRINVGGAVPVMNVSPLSLAILPSLVLLLLSTLLN